jgi:hypothetical protein
MQNTEGPVKDESDCLSEMITDLLTICAVYVAVIYALIL